MHLIIISLLLWIPLILDYNDLPKKAKHYIITILIYCFLLSIVFYLKYIK